MTISPASGVTNANYVAIYSAAAAGQDYKWHIGAGQSNGFAFSHFTATGNQSSDGVVDIINDAYDNCKEEELEQ